MKHQHGEVWGLQPQCFEELSAIFLSELFFCFCVTVEINCYIWLSRPRLLKYWRTERDWLSEVERLGQSRLIRQTKCYFCFLCGWGVKGGAGVGSSLLSHYQRYLSSPCQHPLLRHFSLWGWFELDSLFSLQCTTPTFTTELSYICFVCVHVCAQVQSWQKPNSLHICHIDTQPKGEFWKACTTLMRKNCHKYTVHIHTVHNIPDSCHTNCH